VTVLLTADPTRPGQLRPTSTHWWNRLVVAAVGYRLDRALAAGRAPESGRLLALRAQTLVDPATRAGVARRLRAVVAQAQARAAPPRVRGRDLRVPVCAEAVRRSRDQLELLAAGLETPAPVAAGGVAAARVLLSDGMGPLFDRRRADDLERSALAALRQLDLAAL